MNDDLIQEIKKMNKLLALVLTKEQDQKITITQLYSAGFKQKEIADLLNTTELAVKSILYRQRKGGNKNR